MCVNEAYEREQHTTYTLFFIANARNMYNKMSVSHMGFAVAVVVIGGVSSLWSLRYIFYD